MIVEINDIEFNVKVASTDEERIEGLRNVKELPSNEGMLFVYDHPSDVAYTTSGMKIDIDIIWIFIFLPAIFSCGDQFAFNVAAKHGVYRGSNANKKEFLHPAPWGNNIFCFRFRSILLKRLKSDGYLRFLDGTSGYLCICDGADYYVCLVLRNKARNKACKRGFRNKVAPFLRFYFKIHNPQRTAVSIRVLVGLRRFRYIGRRQDIAIYIGFNWGRRTRAQHGCKNLYNYNDNGLRIFCCDTLLFKPL